MYKTEAVVDLFWFYCYSWYFVVKTNNTTVLTTVGNAEMCSYCVFYWEKKSDNYMKSFVLSHDCTALNITSLF